MLKMYCPECERYRISEAVVLVSEPKYPRNRIMNALRLELSATPWRSHRYGRKGRGLGTEKRLGPLLLQASAPHAPDLADLLHAVFCVQLLQMGQDVALGCSPQPGIRLGVKPIHHPRRWTALSATRREASNTARAARCLSAGLEALLANEGEFRTGEQLQLGFHLPGERLAEEGGRRCVDRLRLLPERGGGLRPIGSPSRTQRRQGPRFRRPIRRGAIAPPAAHRDPARQSCIINSPLTIVT